jgi:alpha-1,6-mannosyltransferase
LFQRRKQRIALTLSAAALWAAFLRLRFLSDLRAHVPETITLLVLAGLFYLFSSYLVLQPAKGAGLHGWAAAIVCIGAIFRITIWPLAPALSDDPYRYRWEGKLQAAGGNPYEARPADARWAELRDATFPRVDGKDFKAVYGPLIEQLELWTYRSVAAFEPDPSRQVFWFKLPYAIFDLGTIAALWLLLRVHGMPGERVLVYAWSPLAIVEFWATGHNDSLVVLLIALAFLAAAGKHWSWAFVALSLAAAAKVWPILLFPLFIGWKDSRPLRWWQWTVAIPIAGLLALPYWTDVTENLQFMSGFLGGWRNNDSFFGVILWVTKDLYRAKYTAFAIVAVIVAFLTLRQVPIERASLWAIALLLMISANCHPWYLTWLLPLLVIVPVPGLLLWTALVPLAYSTVIAWVETGEWHGSTAIRWVEYAPVYASLIGCWLVCRLSAGRRFLHNSARTPE